MSASAAATVVNAAQKASNFANTTVETARFEVLKEPLGFIKVLQFLMGLLAFAIAVNGSSSLFFSVNCSSSVSKKDYSLYQADFSYPYDVRNTNFKMNPNYKCNAPSTVTQLDRNTITSESNNIVSSSQFFVFTGVVSFLYSIAFTVIYVFFRHKYNNIVYFSLIDFASTALLTLFWFCGSIAWAKAISDLQSYTNPENVIATLPTACPTNTKSCSVLSYPTYANVIVSCILGFGNLILWAGDVWFVLKETSWYKTRQQMQQQTQNVTNNPISANDISISAHYNANNKI